VRGGQICPRSFKSLQYPPIAKHPRESSSKDKDSGKDEETIWMIRTYKKLIDIKTEASWPMSNIDGTVGSTGFNWVQFGTFPIFVSSH